jgi:hypothetical protein
MPGKDQSAAGCTLGPDRLGHRNLLSPRMNMGLLPK